MFTKLVLALLLLAFLSNGLQMSRINQHQVEDFSEEESHEESLEFEEEHEQTRRG